MAVRDADGENVPGRAGRGPRREVGMAEQYLLGIDVGSTTVKAVAVDAASDAIA